MIGVSLGSSCSQLFLSLPPSDIMLNIYQTKVTLELCADDSKMITYHVKVLSKEAMIKEFW